MKKHEFNFGDTDDAFKNLITTEIFRDNIYEKVFEVESGDIVFDIGASIGPFTYSIIQKNPKHVFCFEPSQTFFFDLVKNTLHGPVTCINKAVSSIDGEIKDIWVWENNQSNKIYSLTFKKIIETYNLKKIDFFKTDCEGGEYDIFTNENIPWIKQNIKKIVGEWHLGSPELKNKFKVFREKHLPFFEKYHVYSIDGVDIKWSLWNDNFIDYYREIIIHIDNR